MAQVVSIPSEIVVPLHPVALQWARERCRVVLVELSARPLAAWLPGARAGEMI